FGNSSRRAIVCKIFSTTSRPDCGLSFAIHAASASISAMAVSSMITLIRHDGVDAFVPQQATRTFDLDLLFGGALRQAVRPSSDIGASPLPPPPSVLRRARLAAPLAIPSTSRSHIV